MRNFVLCTLLPTFFVNNFFIAKAVASTTGMNHRNNLVAKLTATKSKISPDSGGECVDGHGADADTEALLFQITPEQRESLLSSSTSPEEFASKFQDFVLKVKSAFDTEGFVVIRGLIDDDLMSRLDADATVIMENRSNSRSQNFASLKLGPVFSNTSLREVALSSAIPRFVALVLLNMQMDMDGDDNQKNEDASSLYMVKDAFLAKRGEQKCCGWHVDDSGFWPTTARSKPGVNAWIAIDDMPAKYGGGLAVSPRSHRASWRQRAYEAIGSTPLYSEEGVASGKIKSFIPCNMEEIDPELSRIIDGSKKEFDFQRGDVLFHTRWLFHRSMALTSVGGAHFQSLDREPTFRRYTVRYEHGDTRLLKGFNVEFAALLNPENKGKSLAQINRDDGLFYPRCWPKCMSEHEIEEMDRLVVEKFPIAEMKYKEFMTNLRNKMQSKRTTDGD